MGSIGIKKQRTREKAPTIKQIKATRYIAQGMRVTPALRKAGYSKQTSRLGKAYLAQVPGLRNALYSMERLLEKEGVTNEAVAKKIAEFVNAKEETKKGTEVPDYSTQIQGVKIYLDVTSSAKVPQQQKKREMTITEFITGEVQEKEIT